MWDLQLTGDVAILVGLLLLPGVIAVLIRDALAETAARDIKKMLVLAAIYDVAVFCGLLVLTTVGLTPYPIDEPFNWLTIVAAIMLAVFLGALTGSLWWRKMWQALVFRTGWSKKGVSNTWVDAFQAAEREGAWALVHLKDGRRVFGVPKYYSASGEKTSLYLACGPIEQEPVTIYSATGKRMPERAGPGVVITPAAEITLVEFLAGRSGQSGD